MCTQRTPAQMSMRVTPISMNVTSAGFKDLHLGILKSNLLQLSHLQKGKISRTRMGPAGSPTQPLTRQTHSCLIPKPHVPSYPIPSHSSC